MLIFLCLLPRSPVNFVITRDPLPHDFQQVMICIPAVDHQRLLHGYGQTQLTLKHLQSEETKHKAALIKHIIQIFNSQHQTKTLLLFVWRCLWSFCGSSPGRSHRMPRLLGAAWPSVCCVHAHLSSIWRSGGGTQMPPTPCLQPANLPTGLPLSWLLGCRSWRCSL